MKLHGLSFPVVVCIAWLPVAVRGGESQHHQAVAAITKLGGAVEPAAAKPGAAITVALTGAKDPAGCFPHLKHIVNLQRVDL